MTRRVAAIRAMIEIGSPEDAGEVRKAFIAEGSPLRRRWLGELLDGLGQTQDDVDWLVAALALAAPKKRFESDPLSDSLASYVAALPPSLRANATVDWAHRETARARMRVLVKRILRKYGYPPDLQDDAVRTVIEQAELLAAQWQ